MATAKPLLGDCREQLETVETNSVDLVVTSPPYANQRAATCGGNSSQISNMPTNFSTATKVIRQGNPTTQVIAVNGC